MSHAVSPDDLRAAAIAYGNTPFLLYSSRGSARVNHVAVELAAGSDQVVVRGFGRGVAKVLTPELSLSLLWPPHEADGFSLIADGTGVLRAEGSGDDGVLVLTISGAVLHRPAPTA